MFFQWNVKKMFRVPSPSGILSQAKILIANRMLFFWKRATKDLIKELMLNKQSSAVANPTLMSRSTLLA